MTVTQHDLHPAAERLAHVIRAVPADALDRPTPCTEYSVGDLLDHIRVFFQAFQGAATKQPLPPPVRASAADLPDDWQTSMPTDALQLADAWDDPTAWDGMTAAGGVDLPGAVAGTIALDELVVHGWDLAVSTGAPYDPDGPELQVVHQQVVDARAMGFDIFAAEVPVPDDAPLFDRILGLAGRDPRWRPPG